MANYTCMSRSNYFQVKDREAFDAAMEPFEVEIVTSGEHTGKVALLNQDPDGGGWPWRMYDEETDEDIEVDFAGIIAEHLADGQVCVLMEIGWEKLRYLTGRAVAFNNRGEERVVDLDDIYEAAADLGENITDAAY